jgi:single-strand DNA-binding protein
VDKTSWHRCVAWRKTGEIIGQYFKKGNQIYIEGSLESRSYEDKSGEKKYITEIIVNNFQFVDSKGGGSTQTDDDNFLDDFEIESSSSDDVPF